MFLLAGVAVTPYDSILYRNLIFDTGGIVTAVDTLSYIKLKCTTLNLNEKPCPRCDPRPSLFRFKISESDIILLD